MKILTDSRWRPHRFPRGFALIATLSMMILLTLVAVGLLTLSTVTVRSGKAETDLAIARANARLGLMIALNQLQTTLGPDQRVTATADLQNPSAPMPKWVGVYGNSTAAGYSSIPTTHNQPVLLNWLVSGNENVQFSASESSSNFGQVTSPPSNIPHLPTTSIPDIESASAYSNLEVGNTRFALLVGENSAGAYSSSKNNFVAAPVVALKNDKGAITGNYAYWVGDEGMKARIDLRDNFRRTSVSANQPYSFITTQRSGIEQMSRDETETAISTEYPYASENIDKAISLKQLPLLGTSGGSILKDAVKYRFHDLTAYSAGVLSDVYAGGLKKDLTADAANTSSSASGTRPADDAPLFPRVTSSDKLPTWGQLRSFPRNIPTSGKIAPSVSSDTKAGISPVITFASLGIGYYLEPVDLAGTSYTIRAGLFPVLVLWNPYNVELDAKTFEIGYRIEPSAGSSANARIRTEKKSPKTSYGDLDLSSGTVVPNGTAPGPRGYIRFRVDAGSIPPGESHRYLLTSTGTYSAGANVMDRSASFFTNHAYVSMPNLVSGADVSGGTAQFACRGDAGAFNSCKFEVVLGEPGSLSPANESQWYHASFDARASRRGGTAWKFTEDQSFQALSAASIKANSALRLQCPFQGNGGSVSQGTQIGSLGCNLNATLISRWLVTGNLRAPILRNTVGEASVTVGARNYGSSIQLADYGTVVGSGNAPTTTFRNDSGTYIQGSIDPMEGNPTQPTDLGYRNVLYDVLPQSEYFLSLGQLQHAALSPYGFYPTYAFGNSWADVNITRDARYRTAYVNQNAASNTTGTNTLYDLSWCLNWVLWDKYFVSGVPSTLTQAHIDNRIPLPNARMTYHGGPQLANLKQNGSGGLAYDKAAANLLVNGAFNIHSTSVEAWKAMLTGTMGIPQNSEYATTADAVDTIAPLARFATNPNKATEVGTAVDTSDAYNYRRNRGLKAAASGSVATIADSLATEIVKAIRERGPFLSMGDFVNRGIHAAVDDKYIKGALQQAIDNSTVNSGLSFWGGDVPGTLPVAGWDNANYNGRAATGNSALRATNCGKFLSQADVLSSLGPALSVRSDSFVVRTYGEAIASDGKTVTARAWCEAVIQRFPEYLDDADSAEIAPSDLQSALNRSLGRTLKITSFRWLAPSEI